jgi:hypothetical protein
MQDVKFVEHPVDNNCKMLYSFTSIDEYYIADEKHKDDTVRRFMDQIKTDMYANEIEVIHPEIDKENDRIIKLDITLINGNVSKDLIRGVINKEVIT